MLKKLAVVATILDKLRLVKEADLVDSVLNKLAQIDLPHDDEDEMDEEFEKYLQDIESGVLEEPEEMEGGESDELTEQELIDTIEGIRVGLENDKFTPDQIQLMMKVLLDLKPILASPEPGWGMGTTRIPLPTITDEGEWGETMVHPDYLPIAEASKK